MLKSNSIRGQEVEHEFESGTKSHLTTTMQIRTEDQIKEESLNASMDSREIDHQENSAIVADSRIAESMPLLTESENQNDHMETFNSEMSPRQSSNKKRGTNNTVHEEVRVL